MKKPLEFIIPIPWTLAGIAVFMLIGAYMFGVDGVVTLFNTVFGADPAMGHEIVGPK